MSVRLRYRHNELWEIRTKGTITRSRANWVHVMEKPTSYFLRLEAHRGNKKCILRLRMETGELLIENNKILEEEKTFFQALYMSCHHSLGATGATLNTRNASS